MLKKYLTFILTIFVLNLSLTALAFARTIEEKFTENTEKVKTNITKLGTGKDARIEVKLCDNTKLKGYVSQINQNGFVIVDDKTGNANEVSYPNAKQVKGNNLSTGVKIVIGVGIVIAIIAIIAFVGNSLD